MAADRTERKRWENEEEEGATKDKRTNGSRTKTESKRLSYIKFRADIKNQRRKCCIRDAPKIRQKTEKNRVPVKNCVWLCFGFVIEFFMLIWEMAFVFHKSKHA